MTSKHFLQKTFLLLMVALTVFGISSPIAEAAIPIEQKRVYEKGVMTYDELVASCSASAGSVVDGGTFAQHLFVGVDNSALAKEILAKYDIGGIFLMSSGGRVSGELKGALKDIQAAAKTPLLIATDQEYTSTVNSFGLADGKKASDLASMDNAAAQKAGEDFGTALAGFGVNMDFAPVVDIQDSNNAVIGNNDRGISSDPQIITDRAKAFSAGLASKGVMPVIKHFPGHGRSSGDSHKELPSTPALADLEAQDLKPFAALAGEKQISVMIGHLNVPGLTEGKPASSSPAAYTYLRDKTNFKGLVITDELAGMVGAGSAPVGTRVSDSLNAGADMALFNVTSMSGFEDVYKEAMGKTTNKESAKILEQKRFFGLSVADANVTPTTAAACCQTNGVSAVNLTGKDNIEKIMAYLMSSERGEDKRLTLAQAAGIIGNFQQESSPAVNPAIIEGGAMADDNYTPSPGTGFGIAQWTPADRQRGLMDMAQQMNSPVNKLEPQIAFLWKEMTDPAIQYSKVLAPLRAAMTPEDAAYIFHRDFEQSNDSEQAIRDNRGVPARKIYDQYADGAPLAGSNSTASPVSAVASTGCADQTGAPAGDFVFYQQWDPASDWYNMPYGVGTMASDGCGPTSVAEVVATFKDKKITPKDTGSYMNGIAGVPYQGGRLPEVFAHYGLTAKPISTTDEIIAGLKAGGIVVSSANGSTPYTSGGHFVVFRAITPDGQILLGDVNSPAPGTNPNNDVNSRPWDLNTLLATRSKGTFNSLNLVTKDAPATQI